jgi:hypothetical protein
MPPPEEFPIGLILCAGKSSEPRKKEIRVASSKKRLVKIRVDSWAKKVRSKKTICEIYGLLKKGIHHEINNPNNLNGCPSV